MNKLKQEEQAKIIKVTEAYEFARDVEGANIEALGQVVLKFTKSGSTDLIKEWVNLKERILRNDHSMDIGFSS